MNGRPYRWPTDDELDENPWLPMPSDLTEDDERAAKPHVCDDTCRATCAMWHDAIWQRINRRRDERRAS